MPDEGLALVQDAEGAFHHAVEDHREDAGQGDHIDIHPVGDVSRGRFDNGAFRLQFHLRDAEARQGLAFGHIDEDGLGVQVEFGFADLVVAMDVTDDRL